MSAPLRFRIPRPVSLNNAYTRGRGHRRRVMTTAARAYKETVAMLARTAANRAGWTYRPKARLRVHLLIVFPDHRRRDLDNCIKLTLDAVADALGFDDALVDDIHVQRAVPDTHNSHAIVTLAVLDDPPPTPAWLPCIEDIYE